MKTTRMKQGHAAVVLLLGSALAGLGACGGTPELSCDEPERYQAARETEPVRVPDDLDPLDEFKELPLPDASPRPERPPGSPCLDLPPNILGDEER